MAAAVVAEKAPEAPVAPLFERIGGQPAVQAAVSLFYTKVTTDPELARFFEGIDMYRLRSHQAAFLTLAFGGPRYYNGRSIALAHRKLIEEKGLTNKHFDIVAGHLVATLKDLGVAQNLIDEVVVIALTLRDVFPDPK